eukprot:93476-Chlamydomonas_euryale.AAC.6
MKLAHAQSSLMAVVILCAVDGLWSVNYATANRKQLNYEFDAIEYHHGGAHVHCRLACLAAKHAG